MLKSSNCIPKTDDFYSLLIIKLFKKNKNQVNKLESEVQRAKPSLGLPVYKLLIRSVSKSLSTVLVQT